MAQFVFTPNPAGLTQLLHSPTGDVARWVFATAQAVASLAKANAPKVTGALANSITVTPTMVGGTPVAYVDANAPYAGFVHEGTGPHPIDPVNARVLRFPSKSGVIVFTPHVEHPGTRAQPFLTDALSTVIRAL